MATSSIHIVISSIPPLLRNVLLKEINEADDFSLDAEEDDQNALVHLVEHAQPHAILIGCTRGEVVEIGTRLTYRCSSIKLIAITDNGREAELFELCPHHVLCGNQSARGVMQTVRRVVVGRPTLGQLPD